MWKAHITPDPVESSQDDISIPREKRVSRFSHVMSNLGGHLRSSITRTTSMDHVVQDGRVRSLPPTPPTGPASTLVDSPQASPTMKNRSLSPNTNGGTPDDFFSIGRNGNARSRSTGPISPGISPLGTPRHHPLLDQNLVPSAPSKPTITFDLTSPATLEHDRPNPPRSSSFKFRPRANSHEPSTGAKPPLIQTNSAGHTIGTTNTTGDTHEPHQNGNGLYDIHRKTTISPSKPRHSEPNQHDLQLHHARTTNTTTTPNTSNIPTTSQKVDREEQRNTFMKFIRDLPNIIHGRHSGSAGAVQPPSQDEMAKLAPRKRQKGEVVCLHYGTIDNLGMRQLEGRS